MYLRVSPPERSVAAARREYEAGIAGKLGVEFSTLCELNDAECSYVWFPRDQDEAERMMMPADGSLKMSALTGPHTRGKGIYNSLVWRWLEVWFGKNSALCGYPFGDSPGLGGKSSVLAQQRRV